MDKIRGTDHVVEEILGRILANYEWMKHYPNVKLVNLIATHSDHNSILLHCEPIQRH